MKSSLRRCPRCGAYSTHQKCDSCKIDTITAHPARFSPDDRYGEYRRKSIKEEYGENGKYDSEV